MEIKLKIQILEASETWLLWDYLNLSKCYFYSTDILSCLYDLLKLEIPDLNSINLEGVICKFNWKSVLDYDTFAYALLIGLLICLICFLVLFSSSLVSF